MNELDMVIAKRKAERATENYIDTFGEHPLNCGFAWVTVKGVRGKKADMLKEYGFKKSYSGPGLMLWNPSNNPTQDMSAKMSGAKVYAEFLNTLGIPAVASCRLD